MHHSPKSLEVHLQRGCGADDEKKKAKKKEKGIAAQEGRWSIFIDGKYYSPFSDYCSAKPADVYQNIRNTLGDRQLLLMGWLKEMKPDKFEEVAANERFMG